MEDQILYNIRTSIKMRINNTTHKIDKLVNWMLNNSDYNNLILKNHGTIKTHSNKR